MTEQNDNYDPSTDSGAETAVGLGKGLDVGTANLAAAVQNEEGGITVNVERNAFLDIPSDVYSKNMLSKLKVPYIVHNGKLVVIGEAHHLPVGPGQRPAARDGGMTGGEMGSESR